jgi:hypothetical protein
MKSNKLTAGVVLLVLMVTLLGYSIVQFVVTERLEDATNQIKLDIASQQTTISALSEVMSRGGVDEVTALVIKDCAADERARFDTLLGQLGDNLPRGELLDLARLFDRCASYYARQKAVMAARFVREVEVYEQFTHRLLTLQPGVDLSAYATPIWQELAYIEQEQSNLFETLVSLQGGIIEALVAGKGVRDPAIEELLTAVRETQEMQAYHVAKMSELRNQLPSAI